jgi:hypothetical protein
MQTCQLEQQLFYKIRESHRSFLAGMQSAIIKDPELPKFPYLKLLIYLIMIAFFNTLSV